MVLFGPFHWPIVADDKYTAKHIITVKAHQYVWSCSSLIRSWHDSGYDTCHRFKGHDFKTRQQNLSSKNSHQSFMIVIMNFNNGCNTVTTQTILRSSFVKINGCFPLHLIDLLLITKFIGFHQALSHDVGGPRW